ncbi:MAG: Do family serine endopeptidase [Cyclobacteriaceae bacterium]
MNKFFQLVIAAVIGSAITMAAGEWYGKENKSVRIEHIDGVPASAVAYTVNENGEAVPLDFTGTADKVTPAVVHIRSTQESGRLDSSRDPMREFFYGPSPQRGPSQSSGSGVIVNENGYIVTNNHVVQGADIVEVTLSDNSTYKAEVIGTDPDTDLAVIKVAMKGLPHLSFVDSDQAKVGQWVLAVGNPFNLNSTVTAGIISAKGRNINIINSNSSGREDQQLGNTAIESFIQTDAAINPGNSGGALVSLDGGLIGINTAIASPTGAYSGYGFAVPSNIVSKVVEDLIGFGTVQRGWLGVTVQSVTSDLAKQEDLDRNEGAYIAGFADNSAAKEAGLKEGDVVIELDGIEIKSNTALIEYIGTKRPGDKIVVTVDRQGKLLTMPVVLKNRDGNLSMVKREEKGAAATLGLQLEEVDSKVLKRLEIKHGVRVSDLGRGKLARYTEMKEGFIITHIDDKAIKSVDDVNEILEKKKEGDLITFAGIYEDFPREYIYAVRM